MVMDKSILVVVLLLSLLSIGAFHFCSCNGDPKVVCTQKERQALLSFKKGLNDSSNRLSSWDGDEDCCTWIGVDCNNITGHVVELHLGNPYNRDSGIFDAQYYDNYQRSKLGGDINPSLLELKHLNYLDLSFNDFGGIPIPDFLGSLRGLRYLNLTHSGFLGRIPHQLGNLSSLRYLNLGQNNHYDSSFLYVDDLGWLSHLSSLEYLGMSELDLHRAFDWLQVVNTLPSLSELHMCYCRLDNIPPSLGYVNFTSLVVLDLSLNFFNYRMPNWLFNLSNSLLHLDLSATFLHGHIPNAIGNLKSLQFLSLSRNLYIEGRIPSTLWNLSKLQTLDLSFNQFEGEIGFVENLSGCIGKSLESMDLSYNQLTGHIPNWLGQLKSLKYLYLAHNSLYGPIPSFLGNISSLTHLYLYDNELNGTLPESLGQLSHLEELYIKTNSLGGIVIETHFAKLSKLKYLDMSSNSFVFKVNSNWIPPFQLEHIGMGSCILGPRFPSWVRTQRSLLYLNFSNARISDTVPTWLWNQEIQAIDLLNNQIHGEISNTMLKLESIDLSSNFITGRLPRLSPYLKELRLSKNLLSGPLSPLLCENMDEQNNLWNLDLSENLLSGELPQCWMHWQSLTVLNLGSNKLFGKIPTSMGSLSKLISLHLRNNKFFGDLPLSLQDCTNLKFIDMGENKLSGNIPNWMGERITNLLALRLQSNEFSGKIPPQICHLTSLSILNLAHNSLSGPIPRCFYNFTYMAQNLFYPYELPYGFQNYSNYTSSYEESLLLVTKGREWEYKSILRLVRSIDLSSNNLSGVIPSELSSLSALRFLNLSRNHLEGKIPENIGSMTSLESLDLSRNHLSGKIPQSMSNLTSLSDLDLSYNNLSGKIPSSTQLQSFDALRYIGNAELCGDPLKNNCTGDEVLKGPDPVVDNEEETKMTWFYISMGPGFVVGFWLFCGVLLFKKTWRYAYFRFLEDKIDQLYVIAILKLAWLKRKLKKN